MRLASLPGLSQQQEEVLGRYHNTAASYKCKKVNKSVRQKEGMKGKRKLGLLKKSFSSYKQANLVPGILSFFSPWIISAAAAAAAST